jgi:hypothetical protein
MLVQELDPVQCHVDAAGGQVPDVRQVEEILPDLGVTDLLRGFAIVLGQLPYGSDLGFLGLCGQAA